MKHTKGKWNVIPEQLRIVDESDSTIASFCYGNVDKSLANAKLAAESPQLLSKLEYTVAELRETATKLRAVDKDKKGYSLIDAEVLSRILEDIANGNQEAINNTKK